MRFAWLAFIWVVVSAVMVVVSIPTGALTYAALACCLLFVRWALAGTVPRSRLAEREANWVPGPVDLDEKRAKKLADLTEPDSDPLPGRPNGALNWSYRDKVDAAEMEDMLDRRCGLGKYATMPDSKPSGYASVIQSAMPDRAIAPIPTYAVKRWANAPGINDMTLPQVRDEIRALDAALRGHVMTRWLRDRWIALIARVEYLEEVRRAPVKIHSTAVQNGWRIKRFRATPDEAAELGRALDSDRPTMLLGYALEVVDEGWVKVATFGDPESRYVRATYGPDGHGP